MIDELLQEIKARVKKENRSPMELYMKVASTGSSMIHNHSMTKEQLIVMCSSLISIYTILSEEEENG